MSFCRQYLPWLMTLSLWLAALAPASGQPARQLANLTPEASNGDSLSYYLDNDPTRWPYNFVVFKGIGYFAAADLDHGQELWRTDGTPEGTFMVADIFPGSEWSGIDYLIAGENLFYFIAGRDATGFRLYRSDGSPEGTYPVRDESPRGRANRNLRLPLGIIGDQLFFSAQLYNGEEDRGVELWTTDGTSAGTRLVKELAPDGYGGTKTVFASSRPGAVLNGKVLFSGQRNYEEGFQLWITDGTAEGTQLLKTLSPNSYPYFKGNPQNFLSTGNVVFFTAVSEEDTEWWRTDGTVEGTFMLPPFAPEPEADLGVSFDTTWNGTLAVTVGPNLYYAMQRFEEYLGGWISVPGIGISDGTTNGTRALRFNLSPISIPVESAGKAWFIAIDSNEDESSDRYYGLWCATPEECRYIAPAAHYSRLTAAGNKVYCVNPIGGLQCIDATTEEVLHGLAVWNPDEETWSSSPPLVTGDEHSLSHFAPLGNRLFFGHRSGNSGLEPWVTDGTPAGTMMLRDISHFWQSSYDFEYSRPDSLFLESDGAVYFPARYRWPEATFQLMQYDPETEDLTEREFFFRVDDYHPWGAELNGVIITTLAVGRDLEPQLHAIRDRTLSFLDPAPAERILKRPFGFTRAGTNVFFFAYNTTNSLDLWRTAGTPETTVRLKALETIPDLPVSAITNMMAVGDRFYFVLQYIAHGPGVLNQARHAFLISDGTAAGTHTLTSGTTLLLPSTPAPYTWMAVLAGGVLMSTPSGYRLTDGTPAGVTDFELFDGLVLKKAQQVGDQLLFIAEDEIHGQGLWRSDGTVPGTYFVSGEINHLAQAAEWNGSIYLHDGWTLYSIRNGETTLDPVYSPREETFASISNLTATDHGLYLSVYDRAHGTELWKSDGSTEGTYLVQDLWPGYGGSYPVALRQIGTSLYFVANDNRGQEPWIMPLVGHAPIQVASPGDLTTITEQLFHFQPNVLSGTVEHWVWHNLPPSLTFNPETGVLSGRPMIGGTFDLTLDAINSSGVSISHITLRVVDPDYARLNLTPMKDSPGQFTISLDAIAGLRYEIQTSTDLVEWETVSSTSLGEFGLSLSKPGTVEEKRFYRVLTLNPSE